MFHGRITNNIIHKINRLQERALRLIYNDHISSFKQLLSKDGTYTIHEHFYSQKNLAIEMLKALNDLSTPDFSELFQLNESLLWLKVKWTSVKNFVFPISTLLELVRFSFNTLVQ